MHAILTAIGTAGNALPYLGWAQALKELGHSVVVIVEPYLEGRARALGLDYVTTNSVTPELVQKQHNGTLALLRYGRKHAITLMHRVYRAIEERHIPQETVLAAPMWMFGVMIASEKFNLPLATVYLQPRMLFSVHDPFPGQLMYWVPKRMRLSLKEAAIALVGSRLRPQINAFRYELGLPSVSRIFGTSAISSDLVIAFFPEWFAVKQPDWPSQMIHAGFPLFDLPDRDEQCEQDDWSEFLSAGEPPLVFSQSTVTSKRNGFFDTSFSIAKKMRRRAVFVGVDPQDFPNGSPEVLRCFRFFPLSRLLPHAAALIHHGGMGTIAQAMLAGIPQITVPNAMDQPSNSRHLEKLGVSMNVSMRRYRAPYIAECLEHLLASSEVRRKCESYAAQLRGVTPFLSACKALEGLYEKYRGGTS